MRTIDDPLLVLVRWSSGGLSTRIPYPRESMFARGCAQALGAGISLIELGLKLAEKISDADISFPGVADA